ncbi:MAG: M13 family metallopeptidase N-terminal domain-containing protein, partial [Luteimonas sp.]
MSGSSASPDLNRARRRLCTGLALLPLAIATQRAFAAPDAQTAGGWGIDLTSMQPGLAPGDDFYIYVNKGWLDSAVRPAGYAQYNELNAMFLRTQTRIRTLLEDAVAQPPGSSRLADLYTSYTDVAAIDRAGLQPIQADLDAIMAIDSPDGVAARMAHPMSHTIVGAYVFLDAGDTRRSLLHLDQQIAGGRVVGLPRASQYALTDATSAAQRAAYVDYIAQTLTRAGIEDGAARGAAVLALETRLSAVQWNAEWL